MCCPEASASRNIEGMGAVSRDFGPMSQEEYQNSQFPAARFAKWVQLASGMGISDWAGLLNLVLAAVALYISIHVFHVQEKDQKESEDRQVGINATQTALLAGSNKVLDSVDDLLSSEQTKLQALAHDLDTADKSLRDLSSQAQNQVRMLGQADASLGQLQVHAQHEAAELNKVDSALSDALAVHSSNTIRTKKI
jgi:uncharacterized protein HemX